MPPLSEPALNSASRTSAPSARRIPALDGIRGLAILFVLLSHAATSIVMQSAWEYSARKVLSPLWFGVNIFFVLSGFLITGILLDTRDAASYFPSFYAKRTLRIFPLYFLVLAIAFLLLPSLHLVPQTAFSEQIYFWTYLYNWRVIYGHVAAVDLGHFWTLAIEEQFYIVWPLIVFALSRSALRKLCVAICLVSICFRIVAVSGGAFVGFRYAYFATPSQLDALCLGALAACILRDEELTAMFLRSFKPPLLASCMLIAVAAILARGFEANKIPVLVFGQSGIVLVSAVVILLSATDTLSPLVQSILTARALRWLGKYSYGIYVYHLPIRNLVFRLGSRLTTSQPALRLLLWTAETLLILAVSSLVAYLSFTLFESRFLQLKHRFSTNRAAHRIPSSHAANGS